MMIKKDSAMLVLADGITWQIVSGDKRASKIVSGLRQVLQLKSANAACRRVIALTGDNDIMPYEDGVKIYIPNNSQLKTVEIYKLLLEPICIDIEDHLGLFIHGALAEYEGMGVILAGPRREDYGQQPPT